MNSNKILFILLCGGSSQRMANGEKKEFLTLSSGQNAIEQIITTLNTLELDLDLQLVYHSNYYEESLALTKLFCGLSILTQGGDSRQASVSNALLLHKDGTYDYVLIHDGARAWLTSRLILELVMALDSFEAIIPVISLRDSLKKIHSDGQIIAECDRGSYALAQTPQAFHFTKIWQAYNANPKEMFSDDAALFYHHYGRHAHTIMGDRMNQKITYQEDLMR